MILKSNSPPAIKAPILTRVFLHTSIQLLGDVRCIEGNLMKLRETVESCILQKFWIQHLRVCGWGLTSANSISHFVTILTLFRMGFFRAAHGCGRGQKGPLSKICHIHPKMMKLGSYTLPEESLQNIWITWHTSWVVLTSAFFHRTSANFAILRNTDIDSISMHNF